MPNVRRRKRIRIGLVAAAMMSIGSASAGTAMGWVMGGTNEALNQFERTAKTPVPEYGTSARNLPPTPVATVPTKSEPTLPSDAWVPRNNAVQWAVQVPPAHPLSGVVVHNADPRSNLIAHFAAMDASGRWIPVASMTVSPRSDAVLHPPAGDYSMTLVSAPVGMTYDQVARIKPSPATMMRLLPVVSGSDDMEPVKLVVAGGTVRQKAASDVQVARHAPTPRPAPRDRDEPMLVSYDQGPATDENTRYDMTM